MSSDAEQEYFSDGIAEEILNVLARVPDLRVISWYTTRQYRDRALESPELARLMKVEHLLEGSVRKSGNTVRITVQLIEARSDTHLWSQSWDREFEDIFKIQDEIEARVAEHLQLTLAGKKQVDIEVDPRAYELVLSGRHLLYQLSPEQARRAEPIFNEAIGIAPDYAPAHAGLAEAYRQQPADPGWRTRIEAEVDRALELNPRDSQALVLRGYLIYYVGTETLTRADVETAQLSWRSAIEANPSNSDARRWLAFS